MFSHELSSLRAAGIGRFRLWPQAVDMVAVAALFRRAIAELFQGDDYIHMFKRREIYRHLSNAADRMSNCANTLHDIVVKMT